MVKTTKIALETPISYLQKNIKKKKHNGKEFVQWPWISATLSEYCYSLWIWLIPIVHTRIKHPVALRLLKSLLLSCLVLYICNTFVARFTRTLLYAMYDWLAPVQEMVKVHLLLKLKQKTFSKACVINGENMFLFPMSNT